VGAAAASAGAACRQPTAANSGGRSSVGLGVALIQTRHVGERVGTAATEGEEIHSGDVIILKVARTSNTLTAEKDGDVHTKWDHKGEWQRFVIEKETGSGAIEDGDKVFLTAWTGNRITVQQETVHAKWDHRGSWQMLTLSRKAGLGFVTNGDSILLRGHLGKNLETDSSGTVQARSQEASSWQELIVEATEPRTTTTTTTTPGPRCVEKQSLGRCQPCLHTEQCEVGSYCCSYMKKCVASSGSGCFMPVAGCVPMCDDDLDPHHCQCTNENFPDNWQLQTCDDSGSDLPIAQSTSDGGDGADDGSDGSGGVGDSSEGPTEVSPEAWELFNLLNKLRADGFTCPHGTAFAPNSDALKFDCRLWRAAKLHAGDMAENHYFSHTSRDGRSPWDRAADQGVSANGENIAAGESNASATLQQLEDSDHHCKNMLDPTFKVAAVGYAAGGSYKHYWTQVFSEGNSSDLDTSCYPPEEISEASLLGAAVVAASRAHDAVGSSHGHVGVEGSHRWEGEFVLPAAAVRTR